MMQQLSFLKTNLTKEVRRKAEKLMSKYRMLDAIIESRKLDLEPKLTVNYQASESQRSNQFHSETEKISMNEIEIEELVRTKRKLSLVYDKLKPVQQKIWDERYVLGRQDIDVYNDLIIPDRSYYRLKREMISDVAEAFNLMAE
jgi:ArpU family phage transcriptional regulator